MAVATRTEAGHAITRRGQVIEFGFWGVWGPAEREAWERDLTRHLDQVAPGFQLLVDLSSYPAQDEATQALHNGCMGLCLQRGLGQAVHVVPSQVMRSQMKRTSDATPDAARFRYVADLAAARRAVEEYSRSTSSGVASSGRGSALGALLPGPASSGEPGGRRAGAAASSGLRAGVVLGWTSAVLAGTAAGSCVVQGQFVTAGCAALAGVSAVLSAGRRSATTPPDVASSAAEGAVPAEHRTTLRQAAEVVRAQSHRVREDGAVLAGVAHEVNEGGRRGAGGGRGDRRAARRGLGRHRPDGGLDRRDQSADLAGPRTHRRRGAADQRLTGRGERARRELTRDRQRGAADPPDR
ncbi:MAG: hypothetical protein IPK24_11765 [Kineosporiaceae bacterium]|nr:hypothetical protein [Kineosporiaceae bacterium]